MKTDVSKTILHVIGQLERGGAERQLILVSEALKKSGWTIEVATFGRDDPWNNKLAELGIEVHVVAPSWNPIWRLIEFARVVRRRTPALIHSWSHHTNLFAAALRVVSPVPLIVSFRGNPLVDNVSGQPRKTVACKWVYERADCVISNSQTALSEARKAGVRIQAEALVGNIVQPALRANPCAHPTVTRIAAAGSLKAIKGHDVLIRSLGQLVAEGFQCELHLAGDGPERPVLEALVQKLDLQSRVHFLGEIEDVGGLLATSHIFVQPSLMEGLSNSLLEAMAAGLPVVATNVGAIPEYVCHGRTGFLVPPKDTAALAGRLRELLVNPALRAALGNAALLEVQSRCGEAEVARKYEETYGRLLSSSGSDLKAIPISQPA
jgi:glycosyltransferase involved in cell wall biosynthesis